MHQHMMTISRALRTVAPIMGTQNRVWHIDDELAELFTDEQRVLLGVELGLSDDEVERCKTTRQIAEVLHGRQA